MAAFDVEGRVFRYRGRPVHVEGDVLARASALLGDLPAHVPLRYLARLDEWMEARGNPDVDTEPAASKLAGAAAAALTQGIDAWPLRLVAA